MKSLKKSTVFFTEIGDSLGTMGKTSKKLTAVFIPCKAHLWRLYGNLGLSWPTYWGFTEIGDSPGPWGKHKKELTAVFTPCEAHLGGFTQIWASIGSLKNSLIFAKPQS